MSVLSARLGNGSSDSFTWWCRRFQKWTWRTFIAFSFEALAILASICFHDDSNASSEEVHMDIQSTNHQKSTLCAAVAGIHALLG
jgi:hypothetical protein